MTHRAEHSAAAGGLRQRISLVVRKLAEHSFLIDRRSNKGGAKRFVSAAFRPAGPPVLRLDFGHPQRIGRSSALAICSVGVVLLSFASWHSDRAVERVETLQAELSALQGKGRGERASVAAMKPRTGDVGERVRRANAVIRALGLPWGNVFASLEEANGGDVALLALEPDSVRAAVRGSVEARNAMAMTTYLDALGHSRAVSMPVLLSHQIMTEDPQRPVRFTFTATWKQE